jgi:diguanylate cyclase (GGDEF)-like protein
MLTDPITGLPGRAELDGALRAELDRAQTNGLPFSLLFVKLEALDDVNARLGRRMGDAVVREFLELLHGTTRRSDTVMRYGESVFALPLRDVTSSGAVVVGEKIRRRVTEQRFLDGTVQLACSVGIASCDGIEGAPLQPLDLLRRADQALLVCERDGCSHVVLWRADGDMAKAGHLDPLLGVFTGQGEKDYRNMRLLWEVLQALSAATGSELARAVVVRMLSLFAAGRSALFERAADGSLRLRAGEQRAAGTGAISDLAASEIRPAEWQLNEEAFAALEPRHGILEAAILGHGSAPLTGFAVPMLIDGRALGALYLAGQAETLKFDATDVPVLSGVAAQLALAFDRERLAESQRIREHRERQALKAELDQLRTVLKQAQFLFRSKLMADLLKTTSRVAATDATVLITGESGTGKEMLAHTLHELSGRRSKPLAIVDCGAIPATLMDSELFGRERGAYTGAERRAGGRLVQADGGTVFLDEIAELPLEVQAKLLRFVQEKTLTMVGGTRAQKVDVRIIAATNRDLEAEVRAGRFREDLFHRLNVVRLRIPPLRDRPDDVLFLAGHFLESFARQYAKSVGGLEHAAEELLLAHDWPGNVRELQNTIQQAVVLAEGDVLTLDDLQLPGVERPASGVGRARPETTGTAGTGGRPATVSEPRATRASAAGAHGMPRFEPARQVLADLLAAEVAATVTSGDRFGPPLGKWLARDLVLEAYQQAGGVAARAAASLGVPETTFSRRLRQAEADAASARTPDSWASLRPAIADFMRSSDRPAGSLLDHANDLLFQIVVARFPDGVALCASLMGVSVPTMKRRLDGSRNDWTPVEVPAVSL